MKYRNEDNHRIKQENDKICRRSTGLKFIPHLTGESRTPPRGVRGIEESRWGITESQMSDWFGPTG